MSSEFDMDKIKELMAALEKSDLTRLKLKLGDSELELVREERVAMAPQPAVAAAAVAAPPAPTPEVQPTATVGKCIESPMVGTFYASPSPSDPPFAKVGDQVSEDSVVCIIEAMKVMNEVKAGVKGKIIKVLVESGHPVEFGAKLFEIA